MKTSDVTRKYKKRNRFCRFMSIFCTLLPLLIYIVLGFVYGSIGARVTLGLSLLSAIFLVSINIIFKKHIRSTIFVLILGIYVCIKNIIPLLLIICITTMLDEFIFTPLANKYKNLYTINKEIDKRAK